MSSGVVVSGVVVSGGVAGVSAGGVAGASAGGVAGASAGGMVAGVSAGGSAGFSNGVSEPIGGLFVSTGALGGAWCVAAPPSHVLTGGQGSQHTGRQRRIRPNSRQAVAVSTNITTVTVQTNKILANRRMAEESSHKK